MTKKAVSRASYTLPSQAKGLKIGTCRGCGGYIGYFLSWARNTASCSLGCALRNNVTASPERDRIIRALHTEYSMTPQRLSELFGTTRQNIRLILSVR